MPAAQPISVAAAFAQSEAPFPSTDHLSSSTTAIVGATNSVSLGANSIAFDLKLPPTAQTQLHSFTASISSTGPEGITGAWLVLDNVEIGPDGMNDGFSFNILVMLPSGAQGSREVKVGQLGKFTWPTGGAGAWLSRRPSPTGHVDYPS